MYKRQSYYCSGYSTQDTSEAVQTFVSAYQEKYDASPNMFAAQGYDAAMIMCAALAKAEEQGLTAGTAEYLSLIHIFSAPEEQMERILQEAAKICRRIEPDCRIRL